MGDVVHFTIAPVGANGKLVYWSTSGTTYFNGQPTGTETVLTVELPHLHHDVPLFKADARLRLRMMQFSLYPRGSRVPSRSGVEPPILIGRERERARLG